MEKPGRKRSEDARGAVLRAMRELVTEQGYAHVTIEKIAARARVGKPTIYRWWQSKNAILAECVLSGEVLPTPVTTDSAAGLSDDATAWFRAVLSYVDDNAPLLRGLVAAAYEDQTIAAQLAALLADPFEAAFTEWAAAGVGAADVSTRGLAQLLHGAILYRLSQGSDDGDDLTEELFAILVSRLRPQA
ncbi:TetR/AcrR family transcriptional regulator [Subtercola sp. YIM 133946]|uniref:TetR/AcrR family transcriptional regulator n=1 Tax=Subtercola sp. YIM 133946 TaxID=3118909 RepID=UPI002F93C9A6